MNHFKNKYVCFLVLVIFMISVQKVNAWSLADIFKKEQILPPIIDTRTYFTKVGDKASAIINSKIVYLQSEQGIEDTLKAGIATSMTIIGAGMYFALLYYIMHRDDVKKGSVSNGTIYYPGDISIKFADVAGLAGAKADMQDIISYLKTPDIYKNIGAKFIKGVLMNGGPGNGKTLLAKAVGGEVNCPFISVNGSSFVQMYVGVGAARVRELFKTARKLAAKYGACIIFIDEIDSLAMQRGATGGNQEHDQTLNALLAEMDGLDTTTAPVIVLGATNRAALLDPAVVRPGRFDRKVEVTKPAIKDRVELLQIALNITKPSESININSIARATQGFSGAELANLINEAAILTANAGRDSVEMADIELAFDNITLGREIVGMDQSDDAKWKTAIHEAGHTIALVLLDKKHALHKLSITPRSNTLGVMRMLPLYESYETTQDDMKNSIVVALSGRLAEEEFGMGLSTGASSDLEKIHSIAYGMVAMYGMSDALKNIAYNQRHQLPNDIATQVEREVQKIIDECTAQGKKLIKEHKKDIEKIAKLMLSKGTVLGDEIYNLIGLPLPQGVEFKLASAA